MSQQTALAHHPHGSPAYKWQTAQDVQPTIDAYFAESERDGKPCTITGLALALQSTRKELITYIENETAPRDVSNALKRAKARCEQWVENQLLTRDRQVAGHIFWLKNNAGWRDQIEVDHTHMLLALHGNEPPVIDVTPVNQAQIEEAKPPFRPSIFASRTGEGLPVSD